MIVAGLIIFLSAFTVIVLSALRKPKSEIAEMERLPLEEDGLLPKEDYK